MISFDADFTVDRKLYLLYTAIMIKKGKRSPDPVTQGSLKKELKVLENRLNKKFDDRFNIAEGILRTEIKTSVGEAEQKLGEKLTAATDKILTHIDPFVKEVRDSHEERAIVAHQISELRDRVDDHEDQIKQLKQR